MNCYFNFLLHLSYCRGTGGSKNKWKWITNLGLDFLIRTAKCQKNCLGPEISVQNPFPLTHPPVPRHTAITKVENEVEGTIQSYN